MTTANNGQNSIHCLHFIHFILTVYTEDILNINRNLVFQIVKVKINIPKFYPGQIQEILSYCRKQPIHTNTVNK